MSAVGSRHDRPTKLYSDGWFIQVRRCSHTSKNLPGLEVSGLESPIRRSDLQRWDPGVKTRGWLSALLRFGRAYVAITNAFSGTVLVTTQRSNVAVS